MPEYVVLVILRTYSDREKKALETYLAEKVLAEMKISPEEVVALQCSSGT